MRKELSISRCLPGPGQLRVPGSAGGQERYRESCARTAYTVALALLSLSFAPSVRAVGHVFCADDMLFFCLSQMCLMCYMLSCDSPHFWLHFSPTTGFRQASNHDRTASVGLYRMSEHGPPNPQFLSTSITKIDGSCSSSGDWRCVAGPALQLSLFQDTSDWPPCVLLCFCAEPQTSREVDQDPEVGLTRQCKGRLCVRLYSFCFTLFITRRRWRVMPRLPEELEESFAAGPALSLLMF